MSREIKFRAWDNIKKEWTLNIMECVSSSTGNIWMEPALKSHKVVIEQFTGLLDRNGKEIYEGDIVFFFTEHFDKATGGFDGEDEHNAIVEWFDNGFAFMDKVPYDPNIECEVIGNIHESNMEGLCPKE